MSMRLLLLVHGTREAVHTLALDKMGRISSPVNNWYGEKLAEIIAAPPGGMAGKMQ
jgi:hypothetical protein